MFSELPKKASASFRRIACASKGCGSTLATEGTTPVDLSFGVWAGNLPDDNMMAKSKKKRLSFAMASLFRLLSNLWLLGLGVSKGNEKTFQSELVFSSEIKGV
jgi:hypothetical protein